MSSQYLIPLEAPQVSLFCEGVEGFCAPAGAQKPSTPSQKRTTGAYKKIHSDF